ncbi:MarR family winged helix-turn-helix transcriptional regulator [Miltoncostaea oceani]|uniref:MarR family winged helix-turn-helix transcriptional regulator n=1 Tax=Miltoncostaea oceani TaxID=2843216 RepID=UPI001C3DC348|nr:MarR family transcriptional regulator [Miltoncostaea oceani]
MPVAVDIPLEDLLGWRLSVAGRLMRSRADQVLAGVAPTTAQGIGVLMRLAERDGTTQTDLARLQRVEPPSMCRMVDRLERDGLVERRPRPGDRRAVAVHLTDAGRDAAAAGAATAAAIDDAVFRGLSPDERRTLAALLGRVLTELADPADPAEPADPAAGGDA